MQWLPRDLSEYTCLFTKMNDWLSSEQKRSFFWRWNGNLAQNFCYSVLPEPSDLETKFMFTISARN